MGFRAARKAAGVSVREVCEVLGVSYAAVYQWELGVTNPTVANLVKLAQLYNCTIDDLLKDE